MKWRLEKVMCFYCFLIQNNSSSSDIGGERQNSLYFSYASHFIELQMKHKATHE